MATKPNSGSQSETPAGYVEDAPVSDSKASPPRWQKPLRWLGENTGKNILGALVGLAVLAAVAFLRGDTQGVDAQLEQIRRDMTSAGYTIRAQRALRLRTAGPTHLFVLEPSRGGSEELRIYNEVDEKLNLALQLTPLVRIAGKATGMQFNVLRVSDFDGDGRRELVGSYDIRQLVGVLRVPIAIAWDVGVQSYEVGGVIATQPAISFTGRLTDLTSGYRDGVDLILSKQHHRVWGAASLAMAKKDVLLAGFPAVGPRAIQINAWTVYFRGAKVDATQLCLSGYGSNRASVVKQLHPEESVEALLRRTWKQADPRQTGTFNAGSCHLGD